MIYIFCATKSEAQAIVEHKKLQKKKIYGKNIFSNDSIHLFVTGVGKKNAAQTALWCKETFSPSYDDVILNIGIAAAPKAIAIGSLCRISTLFCGDAQYTIAPKGYALQTVDHPQSKMVEHLVDMEACALFGVFKKRLRIYKIVSDHFEPHNVTKERTKRLIASVLDAIEELR